MSVSTMIELLLTVVTQANSDSPMRISFFELVSSAPVKFPLVGVTERVVSTSLVAAALSVPTGLLKQAAKAMLSEVLAFPLLVNSGFTVSDGETQSIQLEVAPGAP